MRRTCQVTSPGLRPAKADFAAAKELAHDIAGRAACRNADCVASQTRSIQDFSAQQTSGKSGTCAPLRTFRRHECRPGLGFVGGEGFKKN